MHQQRGILKIVLREWAIACYEGAPSCHCYHVHGGITNGETLALESGYQSLDRQRRTTLGSIIHKHVRALSLSHHLLNQC